MSNLKKILIISLCAILPLSFISCKNNKQNDLKTIKLNEVTRSVFYAPMYAAINNGFFEEEGLSIDLSTGQGADKTMQQVLSKSVDIGFCGPEQSIYIYNQGKEDHAVVFAQLTQKDGAFLVGKNKEDDFTWKSLKGKTVIGGRPGGVPEMAFEYVLRQNGLDPKTDLNIITNIALNATTGAFIGGTGDYVTLFEPNGSMLEKEGTSYIVSSIGESAGNIPYTTFFATKSYIENNPTIIESFTKAIYRGQIWVQNHTDKEVAESITSFFPGTDIDILTNVVKNYRNIDAFASEPIIKESDYNRLLDIIESYDKNLLPARPPFSDIISNSFAENAINDISK